MTCWQVQSGGALNLCLVIIGQGQREASKLLLPSSVIRV